MQRAILYLLLTSALVPGAIFSQTGDPAAGAASSPETDPHANKRILFIIPNFRTSPTLANYKPLTSADKFKIARQDAFDPGTFALAAAFAGTSQLSNSERSFGQGVAGYARYFGTAYGDFMIGDFLTEGILPSVLHQDPRYFRRGKGSGWGRLGYSASQIFLTHGDSGRTQFNFSEVGGNSAAVAISMAYYPGSRSASDAATKLGTQLAVDMASNILKEFWPDISHKFSHKDRAKGN